MKGQIRSSMVQRFGAHRKAFLVALVLLVLFSVAGAATMSSTLSNTITTPTDYIGLDRNGAVLPPATGGSDKAADGMTESVAQQSWDRMVIRTATLQLTVKDVGTSVDRIRSLTSQHGGYVTSSEMNHQGDYSYSTVTIQVPSRDFDQVMPLIERMDGLVVNVVDETVTSSDVTEEYTDLQSQLRNLQATEARMLALQAKADKIEDVLAIDHELRDVQGQIETIQGRVNYLGKRAEMSTVTITLWPESAPIASEQAWQPLREAENAWNDSMEVLAGVSMGLIRVSVFLWWLIPICLLGALILRRSRRRTTILASQAGDAQAS